MRNHAIAELESLAEKDSNVMLVYGDLGFGVLDRMIERFPDRCINAGISEQNMMGLAAGMALTGKKVFVYSIGNFPGMRCLEQIRNDVCYPKANVKIIVVGGGFAYGQLGMSHHATEDIAVMNALPNMTIYAPADPEDAIYSIDQAYQVDGPCYIRLGKGREPNLERSGSVQPVQNIVEGKDVAIIATGSVINEAIEAAKELKDSGISAAVFDLLRIKPLDKGLNDIIDRFDTIITVEEHNIIGGIGSIVAEQVAIQGRKIALIKLGLKDCFTSIVGSQSYLREYYGLSKADIVKAVKANRK